MGLGDEIMAAGAARRERARLQSGPVGIVDRNGKRRWHPLWEWCPDVARPHVAAPTVKNAGKARPYIDQARSTSDRWHFVPYRPEPARVELPPDLLEWAKPYAGRVIIEPNLKPEAPVNKDWGWENWEFIVRYRQDRPWLQIGPEGTRRLGAVEFLETPTFGHALAVMAAAKGALVHEGGLHHAAAAFGKRAVVLFGGYVGPQNTGYDFHVNLFTGGDPCGNRRPCNHCRASMQAITRFMVDDAIWSLL